MSKYQITNPNNSIVRDCKSRTTENGFDMLMGVAGFAGPVGAGISLYWGTIGKPLTRMHAKTITEQMKMGINPGLPAYQPFK